MAVVPDGLDTPDTRDRLEDGDAIPRALMHGPPAALETVYRAADGASATKTVSLRDLLLEGRKKSLVVFFYPRDNTPGCTREAQEFSAASSLFADAGAVLVGVSRDSLKSHTSFRTKYDLRIPLMSDPDRILLEGFGAWGEKSMYGKKVFGTIRTTFLIHAGGVVKVWRSVKVVGHVPEVLKAAEALGR